METPIEKLTETTRQCNLVFYSDELFSEITEEMKGDFVLERGMSPEYVLSIIYYNKKHFTELLKDENET
jgi:hypothetical protein